MLLFGIIFETSQQNKLTLCIQQQENKFKFCGRNCFWKKEIFTFLWVFLHFCEKWFLNPWFINPNLFSSSKEEANISFVIFTKIESNVSFSTCLHFIENSNYSTHEKNIFHSFMLFRGRMESSPSISESNDKSAKCEFASSDFQQEYPPNRVKLTNE